MPHLFRLSLLAGLTLSLAACGQLADHMPVGVANYNGPTGNGTDTTQALPARVTLSGRILGVSAVTPTSSGGDSLRFEPLARATVKVMQNVVTNGQASQVLVIALLTDNNGGYTVNDLPGGYYIVYGYPAKGSPYADSWTYASATQASVTADVYAWKKP